MDNDKSPRRPPPVPGVFGPDEADFDSSTPVERLSGYPDDPTAPPPSSTELKEDAAPTPTEPSGFPDDPAASPPESDSLPALSPSAASVEEAKAVTRSRLREIGRLFLVYARRHWPVGGARPERVVDPPPRLAGRLGQVIPFLRAVPWLLVAVFLGSFAWDFPGSALSAFGRSIPLEGLLRIVSVSGLIGFLTNWLAITMLFQPREKRAIIPQGLIPAQRERVIYRLAQAISQELINEEIIKQKIKESGAIGRYRDLALDTVRGVVEDPAFRTELKRITTAYAQEVLGSESVRRQVAELAAQKVEEQAGGGVGGLALRLYRTFAEDDFQRRIDRAVAELPSAVAPLLDRLDASLDAVPAKVEARADELEAWATNAVLSFVESFDVHAMIVEKARGFDEGQLENLLKSTSNEQLNYIKYLGGILGLFGGLVIWEPVLSLGIFALFGVSLWLLDEALIRARH